MGMQLISSDSMSESDSVTLDRINDNFIIFQNRFKALDYNLYKNNYDEVLDVLKSTLTELYTDVDILVNERHTNNLFLIHTQNCLYEIRKYLHHFHPSDLPKIQPLLDAIKVFLENNQQNSDKSDYDLKNNNALKGFNAFLQYVLANSHDVQKPVLSSSDDLKNNNGTKYFYEFKNEYLEYVRTNFEEGTFDNAHRVLKLFSGFIGNKPLNEFKLRDIEEYKKHRIGSVKNTTINIDIRTLKAAFEVAVDWELIPSNPFKKAKQLRVEEKEPRYLKQDELEIVCKVIKNKQIQDIIRFAAYTGLRRGELLNLKWSDIDFKIGAVKVESGQGESYKVKGGKMRWVPLNPVAVDILKNQVKKKSEFIFSNRKGDVLDGDFVSRKFKAAIRATELSEDFRFHDLRATFATWAISSAIPIYAVKEMLGHSSVVTTQGYSKFDNEQLLSEIKKFKIGNKSKKIDDELLTEILGGR